MVRLRPRPFLSFTGGTGGPPSGGIIKQLLPMDRRRRRSLPIFIPIPIPIDIDIDIFIYILIISLICYGLLAFA